MRRIFVKTTALVLASIMAICAVPLNSFAAEKTTIKVTTNDSKSLDFGEAGGYLAGSLKTTKRIYTNRKFSLATGHGFAAEESNNINDVLKGYKAEVVGNNNVKNGADRVIKNKNGTQTLIQDKYYSNAKRSVNSAFEDGKYRYVDENGNYMQLEVPADQYKDAVKLMKERIKQGQVPNVTDENEASNIIRKSKVTYKQARNITKAGNIDSLKFDAKTGVISAAYATGISFAINYTLAVINGENAENALKNSINDSLKTGAIVGITHILANQLARTGVSKAFVPASEKISALLGTKLCKILVESAGKSVAKTNIMKTASKLISSNLLTESVMLVVITTPDVIDLFKGRISPEQLIANLTVSVSGLAGATGGAVGGAAIGSLFPGAGTAIGGVAGGIIGGVGASAGTQLLIDNFTESDAEKMYKIIQTEFTKLAKDYTATKAESNKVVSKLQEKLDGETIKDMYSAKDRAKFADNMISKLFEEQIAKRKISIPSDDKVRTETKIMMQDVAFIH